MQFIAAGSIRRKRGTVDIASKVLLQQQQRQQLFFLSSLSSSRCHSTNQLVNKDNPKNLFFSSKSLGYGSLLNHSSPSSLFFFDNNNNSSTASFWNNPNIHLQQVRWKRHDRSTIKPRPPTAKQRKKYRQKLKKLEAEKSKHNAPGSKAGPRRQILRERWQQLLDKGTEREVQHYGNLLVDKDSYGFEDAMLDDIMGNTSHLTSQQTPQPVYLGHRHRQFYNQVSDQMEQYKDHVQKLKQQKDTTVTKSTMPTTEITPSLPSDQSISNVIRAYRDLRGTRNRPIGIAEALQHVIKDLGIPPYLFGEFTYTSLLTCCRTPKEARRIFKLMKDNGHTISPYSWSILVDVHAKLGDFKGCSNVLDEMVANDIPPTQAAYTSLLAACYKVCNDGRIPHDLRAKAGEVGWTRWQELRIIGLEPDAMAYGAIIRLCAARGQPERALNLLQEMVQFGVKPTTLCFSSALRAVAKSHEIAVRFERGSSKKQLRRETFAAHHGQLARSIVIMAENAEVEIDDGYVAALMLCAAAAGDSATAKAVYLASEVRKLDHLRTIGPDSHLKQLRGEIGQQQQQPIGIAANHPNDNALLPDGSTDNNNSNTTITNATDDEQMIKLGDVQPYTDDSFAPIYNDKYPTKRYPTFQEREYGNDEYGKDTRCISALLRACSRALSNNGLGTIWAGSQNQGYLCDNSLRLITTRWQPKYRDTSIPGLSPTEAGVSALREMDEREPKNKNKTRRKYRGLYIDDEDDMSVDTMDESLQRMLLNEKHIPFNGNFEDFKKQIEQEDQEIRQSKPTASIDFGNEEDDGIDDEHDGYGDDDDGDDGDEDSMSGTDDTNDVQDMYFDHDTMSWKTGTKPQQPKVVQQATSTVITKSNEERDVNKEETEQTELYFDYDTMRWKERQVTTPVQKKVLDGPTDFEKQRLNAIQHDVESKKSQQDEEIFDIFYEELQNEIARNGEDIELSREEAMELFESMKDDFAMNEEEYDEDSDNDDALFEDGDNENNALEAEYEDSGAETNEFDINHNDESDSVENNVTLQNNDNDSEGIYFDQNATSNNNDEDLRTSNENVFESSETLDNSANTLSILGDEALALTTNNNDNDNASLMGINDPSAMQEIKDLQTVLPGLPLSRVKKIRTAFKNTLGYPSMLVLVPLLRENMPDVMTDGFLKDLNIRNAEYIYGQAKEDGIVDVHILNSMLEVETRSSRLDRALSFHQDEFKKHGMKPTAYSDRIVLQMLVESNRLPRALSLKQQIEQDGRYLDIPSYGSLVEYYARHKQLGSALLLVKECIEVNGGKPSESYLKNVRLLVRQQDLDNDPQIQQMLGEDPIEWLRVGETKYKREMSKKGKRDVFLLRNRLLSA